MKVIKNKLNIELNLRTEEDFPIKGIEFIDITPLVIQKDVFNKIVSKFKEEILDKKIDYIIAPEARGFLFGGTIAYQLGIGFIPVRKVGKMPPTTVVSKFEYEKEYGKDILELPKLVNEEYKNKNFYIIDDIYATGNTVKAIKTEIEKLGGNVKGIGVVLNIVELNNDSNEVFSLIDVNEE